MLRSDGSVGLSATRLSSTDSLWRTGISGSSSFYKKFADTVFRGRPSSSAAARRPLNLNLNTATSQQLQAVYGIGPVLSRRILEYRDRLGGYWSVGQLLEVRGITPKNFPTLASNFYTNSLGYIKFSINFALPSALSAHPYFTKSMVRRIEAAKLKGGVFTTLDDLIDQDILLPSEAQRVAPYLSFALPSDTTQN